MGALCPVPAPPLAPFDRSENRGSERLRDPLKSNSEQCKQGMNPGHLAPGVMLLITVPHQYKRAGAQVKEAEAPPGIPSCYLCPSARSVVNANCHTPPYITEQAPSAGSLRPSDHATVALFLPFFPSQCPWMSRGLGTRRCSVRGGAGRGIPLARMFCLGTWYLATAPQAHSQPWSLRGQPS